MLITDDIGPRVTLAMEKALEPHQDLMPIDRAIYLLIACGVVSDLKQLHRLLGDRDSKDCVYVDISIRELMKRGFISAYLEAEK